MAKASYCLNREQAKVIGVGVQQSDRCIYIIYVYMHVCLWTKNRTIVINSPFQTFAVTFRRIYRLALPMLSPDAFLVE